MIAVHDPDRVDAFVFVGGLGVGYVVDPKRQRIMDVDAIAEFNSQVEQDV